MFLEKKLRIEENQTEQAKRNRELINSTFDEVECFLMPNIGEKAEDYNFDGRIEYLSPRFVPNMKEMIEHLFEPIDELDVKKIKDHELTCEELVQYFKSYAQIFNGDQLPTPEAISTAQEKVAYILKAEKAMV